MPRENSSVCPHVRRFGRPPNDGGYFICMSSPFTPKPADCLVYSFGYRMLLFINVKKLHWYFRRCADGWSRQSGNSTNTGSNCSI